LLLPWRETTVIGGIISQWRELGEVQIAVVLRPDDAVLSAELDRCGISRSDQIENPRPERGMFSSVVCAANWDGWQKKIAGWAIVLGDQPHLRPETLRRLLEMFKQNPEAICQPVCGGCKGHPILLPRAAFIELRFSGATTLKEFLELTPLPRVQCSVADAGLSLDMDTPEDYKRLTLSH